MASFIKLDNEFLTADGCITRSRQMMNGHKFELFLLDISFIGWYFVVVFTLGMGYGYVYSYTMMARAVFYNKISGHADINDNVEFYNGKEIVNEEIIAKENKFKKANPLDIFIIILLSVIMMSISSYSAYTSIKNRNINQNQEYRIKIIEAHIKHNKYIKESGISRFFIGPNSPALFSQKLMGNHHPPSIPALVV